ncbi:MAG: ethanolamine ammonia-lyase reactivating factor EutA [Acidimicrobiales bacterium]
MTGGAAAVEVVEARPRPRPQSGTPAGADAVELTTVGIDVGSATYHVSISRVRLERHAQELSSRYDVVAREALATSPVFFTPYRDDATAIDAESVGATVRRCYEEAGVDPAAVDSGVVLLTGAALARHNARALADQLAGTSGRFVCAAAGHHFEAVLAAHGSGAVARSADDGTPVVAMDIGGATTKLAVAVGGEVRATAALACGGRLLAWDGAGRLTRVEAAVVPLARRLGSDPVVGAAVDRDAVRRLCDAMADAVVGQLRPTGSAEPVDELLALSEPLPVPGGPWTLVASGGVSEYLEGAAGGEHDRRGEDEQMRDDGDLGPMLARAVRDRLRATGLEDRLRPASQRIRATVIGAAQFTTQVSGSTIRIGDGVALPLHHVPVVRPPLVLGDAVDAGAVAATVRRAVTERLDAVRGLGEPPAVTVAIAWEGPPAYARLRALAEGVHAGTVETLGDRLLVLALDRDLAATLGRILVEEVGADDRALLCLDDLDLADLDHLDIGQPAEPAGVVPVVVKSLLFGPADEPPSPRAPAPDHGGAPR